MRNYIFSLSTQIGSQNTKSVLCGFNLTTNEIEIFGYNQSKTEGYKQGFPVNSIEIANSIKSSIQKLGLDKNINIERINLGLTGMGLQSTPTEASAIVTKGDGEVSEFDLNNLNEISKRQAEALGRIVLNVYPIEYLIDDKKCYGTPIGEKASRISMQGLSVYFNKKYFEFFRDTEKSYKTEFVSPIMESINFVTSENERIAGVMVVDIGHDVTTFVVVENDNPIMLVSLPAGGRQITQDLALALRIDIEEAEKIKKEFNHTSMTTYKKIIDDTINKRLSIIFDDINKYLKKINRAYLLPGGAVIIGGCSKLQSIEAVAKKELGVPAKVHYQEFKTTNGNIIRDPVWYELCFTCINDLNKQKIENQINGKLFVKTKQLFKKFIEPFLP